ncbi:hypothetical protein FKR81_41425 [Lentzea tibetensis]|uniref:Uncharacterized protein n=1 Tax=Lentzea tibetensis TaxID=2591470 RepID=A0A563EF93_9PSEU|nr:hypothetical protein [Lentzea tibetensis]TWP44271.1 hypothetical protein FKR81_41425 [Lentzea tibetensis]
MTTAARKEIGEEPQESVAAGGVLEDIKDAIEVVLDKVKHKHPADPKTDNPKTGDPEPDPCCGPINAH